MAPKTDSTALDDLLGCDWEVSNANWDFARNDPESRAARQQAKKDAEVEDIESFLAAYPRATNLELSVRDVCESPDAICDRSDGSKVGVEITNVRRSPDAAFWEAALDHQDEMDSEQALDEIVRLIAQKSSLRPQFKIAENILVLAICEADFQSVVDLASHVPVDDWRETGFCEIWLADFKGIRDGAHREVRLYGLYPEKYRTLTPRSIYDQKPYG